MPFGLLSKAEGRCRPVENILTAGVEGSVYVEEFSLLRRENLSRGVLAVKVIERDIQRLADRREQIDIRPCATAFPVAYGIWRDAELLGESLLFKASHITVEPYLFTEYRERVPVDRYSACAVFLCRVCFYREIDFPTSHCPSPPILYEKHKT
jgi:hypothetical protein